MKHAKMLALAAVAAGVLMALIGAGSASATVICSTTADPCPAGQGWPVGTQIDFSLATGASAQMLETKGNSIDTCKSSTIKGELSASETGPVTELTWGTCTFPTTTKMLGKFRVEKIAGTSNGTLVADGTFEWTINSPLIGDCQYRWTSGVAIGELAEGNPPILHVNALVEEVGGKVSCPDDAVFVTTYTLTSPSGTTGSISAS